MDAVAAGGTVIDPEVVRQLLHRPREAAVGKHVGNILTKLDLPPSDDTSRRVLAVLTYLRSGHAP